MIQNYNIETYYPCTILIINRWVALMIQLEQQQHAEFVGGWGGVCGWGGGLHQLPISSSLGLDQ